MDDRLIQGYSDRIRSLAGTLHDVREQLEQSVVRCQALEQERDECMDRANEARERLIGKLHHAEDQLEQARRAADEVLYVMFHYYGDEQYGELVNRKIWEQNPWLSENGKDCDAS